MNSPVFVGHIDAIEQGEIFGWALNLQSPGEPVKVRVYVDGALAAEAVAGYYRPDVAKALSCSGRNGFYIDLVSHCLDCKSALIDVRFPNDEGIEGGPLVYRVKPDMKQSAGTPLMFMRIPKTAGTAFREMVMQNYRQSEVMYIYGDPPGFPSTYLGDLPLAQRARLRLVFGHYGYGVHCHMPHECRYAALIRHPLARIWSHYSHLTRHGEPAAKRKSIADILEENQSVHLDNLYVRYFCGLSATEIPPGVINLDLYERALANAQRPNIFLRMQDNLASAYDSLAQELGWIRGLASVRMNESPQPELLPGEKEIKAIQHFNRWDFQLYPHLANLASL